MSVVGFVITPTALGPLGVAYRDGAILRVLLPGGDEAAARDALARHVPEALPGSPPPPVEQALARIREHLEGRLDDLRDVVVDLDRVPAFHRRVYEVLRDVPPGQTRTYGQIAGLAGAPGAARAVGRAMGTNPCPIVVPCHRVLAADGFGGFSAPGGTATKRLLLRLEGAWIPGEQLSLH